MQQNETTTIDPGQSIEVRMQQAQRSAQLVMPNHDQLMHYYYMIRQNMFQSFN